MRNFGDGKTSVLPLPFCFKAIFISFIVLYCLLLSFYSSVCYYGKLLTTPTEWTEFDAVCLRHFVYLFFPLLPFSIRLHFNNVLWWCEFILFFLSRHIFIYKKPFKWQQKKKDNFFFCTTRNDTRPIFLFDIKCHKIEERKKYFTCNQLEIFFFVVVVKITISLLFLETSCRTIRNIGFLENVENKKQNEIFFVMRKITN